jgi:hypothetical protein
VCAKGRTVNADVRHRDGVITWRLRSDGDRDDNRGSVHGRVRRRATGEHRRQHVLPGLAGFDMNALLAVVRRRVVFVEQGRPVVVLGMIVVAVVVNVQHGPRARGCHQRRNEQQGDSAVHAVSVRDGRRQVKERRPAVELPSAASLGSRT